MHADLPRLAPTRGPRGPCFCLMALLLLLGVLALGAAALALREPCAGAGGAEAEAVVGGDLWLAGAGPR